jgi:hypothetical protein
MARVLGVAHSRFAPAAAQWLAVALACAACGSAESPAPAKQLAGPDAADGNSATTADPDAAAASGDDAIQALQPQAALDEFTAGGLLARQFAVAAAVDHPLDQGVEANPQPISAWLQQSGDLAEGEPVWTAPWQAPAAGQRRVLVLDGAVQLPWNSTSPPFLAVSHVGSVRIELGGKPVFEQRNAAEVVNWKLPVQPQGLGGSQKPTWVALRVVYAPQGLRQHLQLWWAAPPPQWQALGPTQLGISQKPFAPLTVQHQLGTANYSAVDLAVQLSVPAAVGVKRGDQWALALNPSDVSDRHQLKIPLQNPSSAKHTLVVQDLWGRTSSADLGVITAKPLPVLEKGGLFAVFHKGTKLADPVATRIDAGINFPSDTAAFGAWVQPDQFSVRWSGGLWIDQPGNYTLFFSCDDGQRMWLDGDLIGELWSDHGLTEVSAARQLTAGWHALQLEMYEGGGAGGAVLEWQPPGKPRALVPAEALGHEVLAKPTALPQVIASEVVRVSGAVRVRLRAAAMGQLKVTRKPSGGPATTENWPGPADSWDRALADWGAGGGQVELQLSDLAGQTAAPVTIAVPPAP